MHLTITTALLGLAAAVYAVSVLLSQRLMMMRRRLFSVFMSAVASIWMLVIIIACAFTYHGAVRIGVLSSGIRIFFVIVIAVELMAIFFNLGGPGDSKSKIGFLVSFGRACFTEEYTYAFRPFGSFRRWFLLDHFIPMFLLDRYEKANPSYRVTGKIVVKGRPTTDPGTDFPALAKAVRDSLVGSLDGLVEHQASYEEIRAFLQRVSTSYAESDDFRLELQEFKLVPLGQPLSLVE